jgi:hypothetical protein
MYVKHSRGVKSQTHVNPSVFVASCVSFQLRSQVALATLYTGGCDGFVTSTAAPIASEWNEPAPGQDFKPT